MPPKRASAVKAAAKTESPSRRKGGTPKKVEASPEPEEVDDDAEEEEEEEKVTPPPARKSGRGRKSAPVADDDAITLNLEDLIDLPEPTTKKRKAPAKSPAAKKSKGEPASTPSKDLGAGDGENLIQCTLCDAKVVQLVRHIRAQHGDDPEYDAKIKEARALEARVQTAGTPRKGASNLLDDISMTVAKMEKSPATERKPRESSGSLIRPKNTQCPICEKVVRRYDLNKHIRNVHSGEKPNKCPYCDYASPWKGNLNTHIAGVHTKARLHDCVRCGLSFKTRSAMIGHMRKVHDKMYQPKERLFECEECNKKFYKKFHLQRHIRVHTGEKPFTCAFCEKNFASKTNMDSHIQSVHLKIKPFKCGYCEKGFARKKMMLVHIRKYHMNKDENIDLNINDMDDVTLDDNIDGASDGSVESGEIIGPEDEGEEGNEMVLIKMKDDGNESTDNVKSYMFVPADELPSDLDTTAETSMLDDSRIQSSSQASDAASSGAAGDAPIVQAVTSISGVASSTPSTSQPIVVNVPAGQVVQAVRTSEGIVLVTQSATVTEHVPDASAGKAAAITTQASEADKQAAETVEPSAEAAPEAEENQAAIDDMSAEPDLVQQALAEAQVPPGDDQDKVSPTKANPQLVASTDELGGLPANLLATEEGDQGNGVSETVADLEFLNDMQTNGS